MSRDECEMNCERILQWARNKKGKVFDTGFVESILEWVPRDRRNVWRTLLRSLRYRKCAYTLIVYHIVDIINTI